MTARSIGTSPRSRRALEYALVELDELVITTQPWTFPKISALIRISKLIKGG